MTNKKIIHKDQLGNEIKEGSLVLANKYCFGEIETSGKYNMPADGFVNLYYVKKVCPKKIRLTFDYLIIPERLIVVDHLFESFTNEDFIRFLKSKSYNAADVLNLKSLGKFIPFTIEGRYNAYVLLNNPNKQAQQELIKRHPNMIDLIKDPSEQLQIAAVKKCPFAIQLIKNPTEKALNMAAKLYN